MAVAVFIKVLLSLPLVFLQQSWLLKVNWVFVDLEDGSAVIQIAASRLFQGFLFDFKILEF